MKNSYWVIFSDDTFIGSNAGIYAYEIKLLDLTWIDSTCNQILARDKGLPLDKYTWCYTYLGPPSLKWFTVINISSCLLWDFGTSQEGFTMGQGSRSQWVRIHNSQWVRVQGSQWVRIHSGSGFMVHIGSGFMVHNGSGFMVHNGSGFTVHSSNWIKVNK